MHEGRPRRGAAASRAVDGVLLLDKPAGITSHGAVQRVRRLFDAPKAGHTGTLDPLATGLLPVCLGEATKFSHALLGADKSYLATIRLGIDTVTGDLEGKIRAQACADVSEVQARAALTTFLGEILQVPPMYSAIKRGGQPLYKLARAGRELPAAGLRVLRSWEPEAGQAEGVARDLRAARVVVRPRRGPVAALEAGARSPHQSPSPGSHG